MQDLVVFYPADLAVFCGVTGPGRRRRRRAGDRAAADVRVRFRVVLSPAARAPTPIRAKSRAGGEAENFASLFLRGPTGKELWFSLAFPFLPQRGFRDPNSLCLPLPLSRGFAVNGHPLCLADLGNVSISRHLPFLFSFKWPTSSFLCRVLPTNARKKDPFSDRGGSRISAVGWPPSYPVRCNVFLFFC